MPDAPTQTEVDECIRQVKAGDVNAGGASLDTAFRLAREHGAKFKNWRKDAASLKRQAMTRPIVNWRGHRGDQSRSADQN